jgi:regulator of nonsense transcripts 1
VDERPFAQKTFSNRLEAANVKDLVNSLLEAGADPKTIGVITPYDGQRERITQALYTSKAFPRKIYDAVEVANVDAFQGREKEIIIISCVRSNAKGSVGFLTDARRLNVALTRARRGLFIIGNHKTLGKNHPWDKLLQAYKDDGLIFTGLIASLHPLQF